MTSSPLPSTPSVSHQKQVGLLFTSRPQEEVTTYFKDLAVADHAPPGFIHTETIPLALGSLGNWPVSMMEQFRKLGVVVEVEEGGLVNRKEINMCTAGEPISPEGARLLVSLGGCECCCSSFCWNTDKLSLFLCAEKEFQPFLSLVKRRRF